MGGFKNRFPTKLITNQKKLTLYKQDTGYDDSTKQIAGGIVIFGAVILLCFLVFTATIIINGGK